MPHFLISQTQLYLRKPGQMTATRTRRSGVRACRHATTMRACRVLPSPISSPRMLPRSPSAMSDKMWDTPSRW